MCREPAAATLDVGHPEPARDTLGGRPLEREPVREA